MRVTQSMISANSLRNISNSYQKMGQYQDQLSTGKKITKPSDDPVAAMKGMAYSSDLASVDQYKRNVSELHTWMDNSESGMNQANSALQRIRELVVQSQDSALTDVDRKALADEVGQMQQDLVKTANTQVAGKYIFHGNDVMNPTVPVENPPTVATNLDSPSIDNYSIEVSDGVQLKANVNPANVFSQELFNVVGDIQTSLQNSGSTNMDSLLTRLDNVMDNMSAEHSELGARSNRLDMVESRLDQQEVTATQVLSDNEDVDMEKVIMDLTNQESVHRAALSVGSRIMQPSLLDFLK
ncbi:flagellar hook-associated protein FlgL [Neobacillus sp. PS3-12]|uniref:flagellar hook-associated protein FlgL n=1 Tax=Neobacillus sp. PS3-12 TaxID=3070677 RepID=UPI0027DEDC51|nr:flagellar hook-associated protein FlgL [Neobacillus sp. PS3-12]WML54752.1 flagellar hook-associated protein FlgL [Neobacillus sp. PS3-12]